MSKKLAEGIDALVLDVKTGRGAFMQSEEQAIELAKTLVAIGEHFGRRTVGFLTDMNQPLGYAVGNWLEVVESIECLRGREIDDLMELTYVLGGMMVMMGGKAASLEEGVAKCKAVIHSGAAYKKFLEMVRRQGGDVSVIEQPEKYPRSRFTQDVKSTVSGDLDEIDPVEVGFVSIMLGAGRTKLDDSIDHKAGIVLKKKVGDSVSRGETLATVYTDNRNVLDAAVHRLERAFVVATEPSISQPLIKKKVDVNGVHPWRGY